MESYARKRLEAMGNRLVGLQVRNRSLEMELASTRAALQQARWQLDNLKQQLEQEKAKTAKATSQLAELTEALKNTAHRSQAQTPPIPVKASVPKENKRSPGQKPGHPAAHRPMPDRIDTHIEVPLPKDTSGKASCPACHCRLDRVKKHRRIVEDFIPARRIVTCYHTASGYCPGCRERVESRHKDQPPAPAGVQLHQGQLGLNSLATAALLRLCYRLPYRQIQQLFRDLPGMSIGASAVARQMQRMAVWLEGQYDRLKVLIRASPVVHMDETGWRVDGQNQWLWTMLAGKATLYHLDKSRGQKVPQALLGEHFGGILVSDFYGAYGKIDCPKQKCLAHLVRELKETSERSPAFGQGTFCPRLKRLIREMLLLKNQQQSLVAARYQGKLAKLQRRLVELERGPAGGWKEAHARRLAKRLRGHAGELTTFLKVREVDPTNNAAERAIRPAVVLRKITGGSRSERGARATFILMSVLKTALQHQCPLFETFKQLLKAHWAGENPAVLSDIFSHTSHLRER